MRILTDIIIIGVIVITAVFVYQHYWDGFKTAIFGDEPKYSIYLGSVALSVTVADTDPTRIQGLSGVTKLKDLEGKLFIFDGDHKYGIWMKDMLFPIDIIWVNKNLQIVHIEENVGPDTYPKQFYPPVDARFVVEVNAHFVSSLKIKEGDRLTLPSSLIPYDIKRDLQLQ